MKTNDFIATKTAFIQSRWAQHLWQKVTAPTGHSFTDKQPNQQSKMQASASKSKANTHAPEPASPPEIIETQTLSAFSDPSDEYEPADLALTELIPAELALLNILPTQPVALSTKTASTKTASTKAATNHQTQFALIEIANTMTAEEAFDGNNDDEYLAALASSELSELSELFKEIEKVLPDLSAF